MKLKTNNEECLEQPLNKKKENLVFFSINNCLFISF